MSVDGVNNNSKAGFCAASAGATVVGGAAGAAIGWYSKPFLKNGAPTDEFVKKMGENLKEIMTPIEREVAQYVEDNINELKTSIKDAKTVEELRNVLVNNSTKNMTDEVFASMKNSDYLIEQLFTNMGASEKQLSTYSEAVKNANNVEEFKNILSNVFDKTYAGKTLEEVKNSELNGFKSAEKASAKATFENFWDSSKKAFVDCEEGVGKAVKKAAQSIQTKRALIYGALCGGIGVVGLIKALCFNSKAQPEQPQNIDKEA